MSGKARIFVDAKIAGKKVVVFSKGYCPFCSMAKSVFQKYLGKELDERDYEVVEIGDNPDCGAIQDYLAQITGQRSVPRVFIGGKCIGGGNETEQLHKQGKLKALL